MRTLAFRGAGLRLALTGFLMLGAAGAGDAAGAPAFEDRLELQELLRQRAFAELEERLAAVQHRYQSGETDDRALGHAFQAFASLDPGFEGLLTEWIEARPESFRPYLARGIHYEAVGWARRGARWARETADGQMQGMREAFGKAMADLDRALKLAPEIPVAHAETVRIAKAFAHGEELRQLASRGLEHDPASYTIRFAYAFALQPKWGGSMEELRSFANETERHIRNNPALAAIRGFVEFIEADRLRQAGRYDEAVAAYDRALRFGETALFHGGRGRAQYGAGRYEAAIADYDRALAFWPQSAEALRRRADALYKLERLSGAVAAYDRALALNPLDPGALVGKARTLLRRKQPEAALAPAKAALEYGAHQAGNWNLVGWLLHYRLERPREAVEYFRRAAELNPDSTTYRYSLIDARYKSKDCDVLADMEGYLELCRADGDCRESRVDWVTNAQAALQRHGVCD